ncbi:TetR/AcrR family transcriptional regulator [Sphingomonas carotinifaciens]|uniref:TetR/AcrR family transcriptional regulator n=1 Tax=Sphingomonas carotinifaciens TaxID=1166323 RepID=UPI00399FCE4D
MEASTRRRLPPEESRAQALDAARALLIESGPQAITLKAVAARMGRTHANLLHHFGSAADLQRALAERMATDITRQIGVAVQAARSGAGDPAAIVALTFDAFGREGGGALASWVILTGERGVFDPMLTAIRELVEQLSSNPADPADRVFLAETTLSLVLTALGQALIGQQLAAALGLDGEAARGLALRHLLAAHDAQGVPRLSQD